jgi:hypothetical protein
MNRLMIRLTGIASAALLIAGCGGSSGSAAPVSTVTIAAKTLPAKTLPAKTVTATVTATKTAPPETVEVTSELTVTEPYSEPETTAEPTSSGSPTGLAIGETSGITASDDGGSAEIHVLSVKHATDGGGESGEKPKNGNYLLIDVQYEATEGAYNYNPYDWTIRDADGRTFEYGTSYYAGDVKELNSGTVAKGARARGVVVIDAPKGPLTLEFGGFGNAPATWNIP